MGLKAVRNQMRLAALLAVLFGFSSAADARCLDWLRHSLRLSYQDRTPEWSEQQSPELQSYVRAHERLLELWRSSESDLQRELEEFSNLSRSEKAEHLNRLAKGLDERFESLIGSRSYALHTNMHGGEAYQYAEAGGIRATHGNFLYRNAASQHVIGSDPHIQNDATVQGLLRPVGPSVFFYESGELRLADFILSKTKRRNAVLILFDIDQARLLPNARSDIALMGSALSFEGLAEGGIGIPYRLFHLPPLEILSRPETLLRGLGRLSGKESALAKLRLIEILLEDEIFLSLRP